MVTSNVRSLLGTLYEFSRRCLNGRSAIDDNKLRKRRPIVSSIDRFVVHSKQVGNVNKTISPLVPMCA